MLNLEKYYLYACFAPSVDAYHKKMRLMHLVSSVFYTTSLNLDLITDKYKDNNDYRIVIITTDLKYPYLNVDGNIFYLNVYFFFGLDLNTNPNDFKSVNFLNLIFSYNSTGFNNKFAESFFSKSLFIFDSISWDVLQVLFRHRNIQISGGSNTRRQLLSTVDYLLVKFLIELGYSLDNIYDAQNIFKHVKDNKWSTEIRGDLSELLQSVVYSVLTDHVNTLKFKLKGFEQEILKLNSKKSDDLSRIENLLLMNRKSLITTLNAEINEHNKFLSNITTMDYDTLFPIYQEKYFNMHKSYDAKVLKVIKDPSIITKFKDSFDKVKPSNNQSVRSYCTYAK